MNMPDIKAVIFDMGNVVTVYSPEDYARQFADNEADCAALVRLIFQSAEWQRLDSGDLTYEEATVIWQRREPRLSQSIRQVSDHWFEHKTLIVPINQLACVLKAKGYPIYLLSNASDKFPLYKDDIPAVRAMDGYVLSYEHHALKPDPALYRVLFSTYSLKPEECFFIDDLPQNIEAGKRLGMDGFVFPKDIPARDAVGRLVERLRKRGVDVSWDEVLACPLDKAQ